MTIPPCLIDLSERAKFQLSGPDRERYLNGQVSNRVSLATTEAAIEACVCNVKGKLDGVIFITQSADGEALLIDAPGELRESLFARLDRYLIADDCEWSDVTEDLALVHALGPLPDLPGAGWRNANRYGPGGHDLWVKPESLDSVLATGSSRLTEMDPSVEEIRIRHGFPRWGAELSPEILPAEAGLDRRAVDFHKGCYLGQEVISRIESVGRINRSLCLIAPLGETCASLAVGSLLFPEDTGSDSGQAKPAGTVTSVTADGQWALAYLKRDWSAPETKLVIKSPEGMLATDILEVRTFESSGE